MSDEPDRVQACDHVLEWNLEGIAASVGIPTNRRKIFRRSIRTAICELWRGFPVKSQPVYRGKYIDELDRHLRATEGLRAWLLSNEQRGAAGSAWAQVNAFLHGKREDSDVFLENGMEFLSELERAFTKAKGIGDAYNKNGRQHGAQTGKVSINMLIYSLIFNILDKGGTVRTSRYVPTNPVRSPVYIGELLSELRPWLPESFPKHGLEGACERIGTDVNEALRRSPTAKRT